MTNSVDSGLLQKQCDWLALTRFQGLGPALISRLLEHFGSPDNIFSAESSELVKVTGIGPGLANHLSDRDRQKEARRFAVDELKRLSGKNISFICQDDDHYPGLLKTIHDPPSILYYHGDLNDLQRPTIAIVGSRSATSYGKRVSFMLARDLARLGITIVSGMACGIDSEAHRGALAISGRTVAVMGCGVDVVYPRQNRRLYQDIIKNGAVISEYRPGTQPEGYRFPVRNRIISGLSSGVIVVEASLRSGSLITARLALEQGREVFAVPGRIDSVKSDGAHRLLQQGAHLVSSAEEVLDELGFAKSLHQAGPDVSYSREISLSREEKDLLAFLDVYPITIDELVKSSGVETGKVNDILLRLELKGLIARMLGQQYGLIRNND